MDPVAVCRAFVSAIQAKDEEGAAALAGEQGWVRRGDSALRFYKQCVDRGFTAQIAGDALARDDRAALVLWLYVPTRAGAPIAKLYALLRETAGWHLEGVTKSRPVCSLFLEGHLAAVPEPSALPADAESVAHAQAWLAGIQGLDDEAIAPFGGLMSDLRAAARSGADLRATVGFRVPGTDRAAVEVIARGAAPEDARWTVWGRSEDGSPVLRAVVYGPGLEGVLEGWGAGIAPKEATMADDKKGTPEGKQAMEAALSDAMKKLGLDGAVSSDGKIAPDQVQNVLLGLFQTAMSAAATPRSEPEVPVAPPVESVSEEEGAPDTSAYVEPHGGAEAAATDANPVVDLDQERARRGIRAPTALETKLQTTARDAFNEYIVENVASEAPVGTEVPVDAQFLKDHGPALFTTVLKAVAKSLIPEEINIELPQKSQAGGNAETVADTPVSEAMVEGDKPRVVPDPPRMKLKVDFNKLIGDFIANATKPKDGGAPPTDGK